MASVNSADEFQDKAFVIVESFFCNWDWYELSDRWKLQTLVNLEILTSPDDFVNGQTLGGQHSNCRCDVGFDVDPIQGTSVDTSKLLKETNEFWQDLADTFNRKTAEELDARIMGELSEEDIITQARKIIKDLNFMQNFIDGLSDEEIEIDPDNHSDWWTTDPDKEE